MASFLELRLRCQRQITLLSASSLSYGAAMVRYATTEDAKKVIPYWGGQSDSVVHLGDQGNSVFSFTDVNNQLQILRFTDPGFRSFDELIAELNFVNDLFHLGVRVARSLQTKNNESAVLFQGHSGPLICSSVAYLHGIEVKADSTYWNKNFFNEWGRSLAEIHLASEKMQSLERAPKRWQWDREILFSRATTLIPKDDSKSLEEFYAVMDLCKSLPKDSINFGLIHADHAPQNFRFDISQNRITTFDFGNSCYHWYAADLAISLSTIRRRTDRQEIRESLLQGYGSIRKIPDDSEQLIDLFIRLRVIYVYLSRLYFWSFNRTSEQQAQLDSLKMKVHEKAGWKF